MDYLTEDQFAIYLDEQPNRHIADMYFFTERECYRDHIDDYLIRQSELEDWGDDYE